MGPGRRGQGSYEATWTSPTPPELSHNTNFTAPSKQIDTLPAGDTLLLVPEADFKMSCNLSSVFLKTLKSGLFGEGEGCSASVLLGFGVSVSYDCSF